MLPKRIMEGGFVVQRSFNEYEQIGLLGSARHNVFLCKWNGENCVLKQEPQIINSILGIITTYQFIITTYQSLQLHISYYNYMSVIITTYQLS